MAEAFRHIVRIGGTDVDGNKKLAYGLAKIRGVGVNLARAIVQAAELEQAKKIGNLTDEEVQSIEQIIHFPQKFHIPSFLFNRKKDLETGKDVHLYGADLTLRQKLDVAFLKEIRCWRGVRHSLGLKVRGQKTRTTGRTGKAVGVKKKALIAAAQAAQAAERKKA